MKKKILKEIKKLRKTSQSLSVVQVASQIGSFGQSFTDLSKNVKYNVNITKNYALNPLAPFALVFNVAPWKRKYVRNYLSDYKVIFVGLNENLEKHQHLARFSSVVIIIWGRSVLGHIRDFSNSFDLPIYHIEDGFVRSIGLGADHTVPMSICLDKSGVYFDSNKPSDLEYILNNYDFDNDVELMTKAQKLMNEIIHNKISKYNLPDTNISNSVYGPKVKTRILVIGQVEDDQSLIYGCKNIPTNLDLLRTAISENPDAQIIYKKHPDILFGKRKELSDISEVNDFIDVINVNMSLYDALNQVDRVYTMTSLAGFEALLHGIPVTTIGAPFYSGWGLTDDRYLIPRRIRKLTLLEVFAAAYMLYPKYRSVDTLSKKSLSDTVEYIVEHKKASNLTNLQNKFDYLSFYNLHTKMRVDNNLITKLNFENVAVISDSTEALNISESISELSTMNVTLITTRDQLANDESIINNSRVIDESKRVSITSIHKKYSVPLSRMENESTVLVGKLAKVLEKTLKELFSGFLGDETLSHIATGINDYCYFEVLRFISMREAIDEYGMILVHLENSVLNQDIIDSIIYYASRKGKANKIFLSIGDRKVKEVINADIRNITSNTTESVAELKAVVASFWHDINNNRFNSKYEFEEVSLVCGNVQGDNYAYSPASKKILESISDSPKRNIIFFNSSFTNKSMINDFKKEFLDINLDSSTTVYSITNEYYKNKYGDYYTGYSHIFESVLPSIIINRANSFMPLDLLNVLEKRIVAYCRSIQAFIALSVDIYKLVDKTSVFFTSMERSTVSRIITSICKENSVPTIGIQPQIVSMSKRYYPPVVDKMGVMYEGQKKVLMNLGYEESRVHNIGSVNINNRLLMMQGYSEEETCDIFFAMQHSVSDLMMPIIYSIKRIADKHNLKVVFKPHPHQELPIYYKVRSEFASSNNIKVLPRESDTYLWIARSKIVISIFSSVLIEAACFGKDVIAASFSDFDESIDMSKHGMALRASNEYELEHIVLDLLNKTGQWITLQENKHRFLNNNPQFRKPYQTTMIEEFIKSNLPKIDE